MNFWLKSLFVAVLFRGFIFFLPFFLCFCSTLQNQGGQLEKKSGSSGAESEETQEAKAAVKKQGKLFGSVSIVNSAEKFVLIKRRAGTTAPGIGSALKTKTARLMVSPERQGGFFVADIVRGEPSNGQRVYAADVSDEQQDMIEKLRVLKASEAVPLPALAIP